VSPGTAADVAGCPVTPLLHRLGDRWSAVVLRRLAEHPHGFNQLDREIEGVSRRMLTRTLRTLEDEGYVSRGVQSGVGGRVEYALTARGRSLREQLRLLGLWAARPEPDSEAPARTATPPARC
jgi:DNA-binding HxlR family transcriptional regulator